MEHSGSYVKRITPSISKGHDYVVGNELIYLNDTLFCYFKLKERNIIKYVFSILGREKLGLGLHKFDSLN